MAKEMLLRPTHWTQTQRRKELAREDQRRSGLSETTRFTDGVTLTHAVLLQSVLLSNLLDCSRVSYSAPRMSASGSDIAL